jgi:3-phenylpropionate/trans-cinnamate dioxygenase ferredoxin reductase component
MQNGGYLIVGGGLTADSACKGIRDRDTDGSRVVVGDEPHPPYRPTLSKALWKGDDESTIWRGTEELGVALRLGRRVVSLDLDAHTVIDDDGEHYRYERLLLATGGRLAGSRSAARRSSTSERSTTTGACARSRIAAHASA